MFCTNCGKEVAENVAYCSHCGERLAPIKESTPSNGLCALSVIGFVFSFFITIVGLICSIIAYNKCREENLKGEGLAVAGVAISVATMVISVLSLIVLGLINLAAL